MAQVGAAKSRGEARKLVASGGVYLNGERLAEPRLSLRREDALQGRYHLLRRGKKNWFLIDHGE